VPLAWPAGRGRQHVQGSEGSRGRGLSASGVARPSQRSTPSSVVHPTLLTLAPRTCNCCLCTDQRCPRMNPISSPPPGALARRADREAGAVVRQVKRLRRHGWVCAQKVDAHATWRHRSPYTCDNSMSDDTRLSL